MRQLFSYLTSGDSDRRASCRSGRSISGAKLKAWRHRMFKFTLLLICLCLYRIINHFACWIMNAFSREIRCPTSMALWHQADWCDLITCESKVQVVVSLGRYEGLFALDPWHVTCSPPIRKRIWVGRYNKAPSCPLGDTAQDLIHLARSRS